MTLFSTRKYWYFFLISPQKCTFCVLIKVPQWGASSLYPQHTFWWGSKKNIYLVAPLILSSYEGKYCMSQKPARILLYWNLIITTVLFINTNCLIIWKLWISVKSYEIGEGRKMKFLPLSTWTDRHEEFRSRSKHSRI